MTALTIQISDQRFAKLQALAKETGMSPEDLVHQCVDHWLEGPPEDFTQAARYVLEKNKELYRRLAQCVS